MHDDDDNDDDDKERRWGALVLWGPFRDFREFVKAAHGGTLQYAVRLPPDDPRGKLLEFSRLYDAVGDGTGTLVGAWRSHPSTFLYELLPWPILPVARDGGGSELYLDLREDSHGTVWAYVHGLPEWAGGDGRPRGGVVAPTWTDYLNRLVVDEDMAREIWEAAHEGAEEDWLPSVVHWLDAGFPGWRSQPWAG